MDFTQKTYRILLQSLQAQGFSFITFEEYMLQQSGRDLESHSDYTIILRHDVDQKPQNSLATAKLEHEQGIRGSYYFRAVPQSWDEQIIKEIASLGHEIGYHYETMDAVGGTQMTQIFRINADKYLKNIEHRISNTEYRTPNIVNLQKTSVYETGTEQGTRKTKCKTQNEEQTNARIDAAFSLFVQNLNQLRQIVDVKTICMHGSPRSKYDNRDIWQKYDYRKLGIIGEPYFDMDFDEFFYLTDTGRRWDGWRVSVRDRVPQQERWIKEGLVFKTTSDIIKAAHSGKLPPQIMITVHPQRWSNSAAPWVKELVLQNVKNLVKRALVRYR